MCVLCSVSIHRKVGVFRSETVLTPGRTITRLLIDFLTNVYRGVPFLHFAFTRYTQDKVHVCFRISFYSCESHYYSQMNCLNTSYICMQHNQHLQRSGRDIMRCRNVSAARCSSTNCNAEYKYSAHTTILYLAFMSRSRVHSCLLFA